jgi:Domain of unknown function (DUF4440)
MQKIIFIFIMLVTNGNHLAAQPEFTQQYGTGQDYKRLWYLNIQYIQSWVHSDTAAYDKLLWAEDFVHQSGANGFLYPKKEIMPIFGEKRFADIEYFYADNTMIQFISDSAAMVFSKPPYCGKNSEGESLSQYNDVYIKRNGNWICVSANISAVTSPGTPLPVLKKIPPATSFVTLIKGGEDDIAEITRLHSLTKEMFEKADYKKADELLDNQFILLAKDGSLFSKKQLIDKFKKQTKKDARPYTAENLFTRFVAADVAMVHGALLYKSHDAGTTGIQFNDIYVKRGNTWKCVSANNTPIKN